jgi:serine protease Do
MQDTNFPRVGGKGASWRNTFASPRSRMLAGVLAIGVMSVGAALPFSNVSALASSSLSGAVTAKQPFGFADLVEKVAPAVVSIQVEVDRTMQPSAMPRIPAPFRDFFRRFEDGPGYGGREFSEPRRFRTQAAGSGFIIDASGYVVTNHHVIDSARTIKVKLSDGREFDAKLIGSDKDTDVALLKIEGGDFPTVTVGDDDRPLRVGDWVVAVGNPFGLGGSVTAGIVSSIGRDIGNGPFTDYIQIDAPINQGNSGGPTFDINGRVVGMNTAIYSPSGGSVGIGFAVPASTIQMIVDQLKTNGSVNRGWLGVQIQNLTPELASSMSVKETKGALVADVVPGSPAERAGFSQGDIVVSLNGDTTEDTRSLTQKVASLKAGAKARFEVVRDGARRTLTAVIEKRDPERLASADSGAPVGPGSLGMRLMPMTPSLRDQYELDDGMTGAVVVAVDPTSEAASKGVRPGDVIKRVGSRNVRAPADVSRGIEEAKGSGRESVLALVSGTQGDRFVAFRIAKG